MTFPDRPRCSIKRGLKAAPNRVAGGFSPPAPHSTPHAGPHGALPPGLKGSPSNDYLQRWLRFEPPGLFHPVGCDTVVEVHPALSLPKVPAFTLSHALRWAFGYYAVC